MSEQEGTSAINLGLASSLISRFDLVLILRDKRDIEWDTRVANHIFYETGPVINENFYDLSQLQAHFSAVRDLNPTVTDGASRILKAYYLACRADAERDAGRTTIRFNDSLYRLAISHAKLLFRNEVTEVDAVMVVMLMESSFGFGRILQTKDVVREDLPLGPSDAQIRELLDRLNLPLSRPDENENRTSNTQAAHDPEVNQGSEDSVIFSPQFRLGGGATITSDDQNESNEASRCDLTKRRKSEAKTRSIEAFDARKYAFQKQKSNRTGIVVSDENMPSPSADVHNLSNSKTKQRSETFFQWPLRLQNYNDDELDRLLTLDEPVSPSTNENVFNGGPIPATENPSSSSNMEEKVEERQPTQRLSIFSNHTDEDLAVLDDLDFNL